MHCVNLAPELKQTLTQLRDDFQFYAPRCLKIRAKTGSVLPFFLNTAQQHIHAKLEEQRKKTGKVRALVLKGRQQGCSTYVEGRFYWRCTFNVGVQAFILTHEEAATQNLFKMAKRYHEYCPDAVKPSTGETNAKELVFDKLDSGYKIGTAGNKAVGRSSTVQYFHGSEVAFWPHADQHAAGIMQTVPDAPGTEVILESTANGLGNYFHQQWQMAERGESEFIAVFVPWFWQEEYRKPVPDDFSLTEDEVEYQQTYGLALEQMVWRRSKIAELSVSGTDGGWRFKQEYPATPQEAFQTSSEDVLIKPQKVLRARKGQATEAGPHVMAVDPARFGDDRTSIIHRRGRKAFGLESFQGKDTMEVAGIVARKLDADPSIQVCFIDVGGLGAGVVDRLRELGYGKRVVAVNFGESAFEKDKYFNKRAEMWALMNEWLGEQPCQIPDSDTLHADLCGPQYSYDSNGRLKLERKEDMKKRGLSSPDEGDALALTFAEPVAEVATVNFDELYQGAF